MKNLILVLAASASLLAGAAPAISPLLSKQTGNGGGVAPDYRYSKRCDVYRANVVVTRTAGKATAVTNTPITLSNTVDALIAAAASGKTTNHRAPIGGGTTEWTAYSSLSDGTHATVTLKSEGGAIVDNDAAAAATLSNLLDTICD